MEVRFDRSRAGELLELARQNQSVKYEALALWHLGDARGAARLATASGSDLLVAQVGDPDSATGALNRITASLPAERRHHFVEHGRITLAVAARSHDAPG
jgi:hypothetical protein